MSRGHQQHRRRTYGRRQHELRERHDRLDAELVEERRAAVFLDLGPVPERIVGLAQTGRLLGWAEGLA